MNFIALKMLIGRRAKYIGINVSLKFVRFEPCVIPKASLTGESTERVGPRLHQVVFSFERGDQSIFVGQQMDIFIDASQPVPSLTSVDSNQP